MNHRRQSKNICVEKSFVQEESAAIVTALPYTDEKENQVFVIYKEILNGAAAKSYMRKI